MLRAPTGFDARSLLGFKVIDAASGAVVGSLTDSVHLELGPVFRDADAAQDGLRKHHFDRAFLASVRADGTLLRLSDVLGTPAA